MSDLDIVRAWKNSRYRRSLSAAELARLPQNPAGPIELTDSELRRAAGFGNVAAGQGTAIASATIGGCCPAGTTAASCTATFGGCCPPDF